MPDNKKQHYVPKFTLRQFSSDKEGKQIDLVNIKSGTVIRGASLRNQCYRNYFYGINTDIEKQLAKLEGRFAKLTCELIETNSIKIRQGQELVMMMGVQRSRTLRAEKAINDQFEKIARLSMYGRIEEQTLRNVQISLKHASVMSIWMAISMSPIMLDLKRFLVFNKTSVPFVISDNPVVLTNWFGRNRYKDRAITGIANSGLQMILPLSPTHALLMHDGNVYSTNCAGGVMELHNSEDAAHLNEMQWLNANSNIYIPPTLGDCQIARLSQIQRSEETFDFQRFEALERDGVYMATEKDEFAPPSQGEKSEIVAIMGKSLPKDIRLPNVKLRGDPQYFDDGSMSSPVRDKVWCKIVKEFGDANMAKTHTFDDLWDYVAKHPLQASIGPWLKREARLSQKEKYADQQNKAAKPPGG